MMHKSFNMRDHTTPDAPPRGVCGPICDSRASRGRASGESKQVLDLGIDRIVVLGPTVDEVEGETKLAADMMVKEVLPAFSG